MKWSIYITATVVGLLAGYIPVLFFHASAFGMASLVWGSIGTIAGIWVGVKVGRALGY
ncbi:MAG TPA: hypothetical protein VGS28_04150 [Candidatus Saccharimonadales bacterium]|nr:hypothetical protein [Candidatus Saccharimonadales bacterium]